MVRKLQVMPDCITVSSNFVSCFMLIGHVIRSLHCFLSVYMVVWICVFHCGKGTRLIPRFGLVKYREWLYWVDLQRTLHFA